MDMKRFFLYCMTGAVLALASGCNGNGGGGMTPTTTPTTPTPPQTNPVSLSGLLMGYMTIPAGTFTVNAGQRMDRGHATFSCQAGGAACRITVAANGTVTSVGGRATAMPSQAARTAKMAADEAARQAAAAAKKKTDGLIMAIKNGQLLNAGLPVFVNEANRPIESTRVVATPETWDADYAPLPGIAVGRPLNTTNRRPIVTPTVPSPLGDTLGQPDEGVADTIEFMKDRDLSPLGAFTTGEVHKRTMKAGNKTTTDEITIYHDKQASGSVPYNEYYANGSTVDNRVNGGGAPASGNVLLGSGTFAAANTRLAVTDVAYGLSSAARNGVLALKFENHATTTTNVLTAAETALLVSSEFPSAPDQTFTFDGTANAKDRTFDGTFHGVAGKFNCTGTTTCSATRLANGNLHLRAVGDAASPFGGPARAGWYFTPTEPANGIMLDDLDHDTDYLVFGTWLQTVEQPGRDTTYKIGTIAQGSNPFGTDRGTSSRDNDQIAALRGKATYTGRAAGRYGLNQVNADGTAGSASTGAFTAKTTLTAQFNDTSGNVSVNDRFSIKGTITDFKDPQHADPNLLSAWSVELQRSKFGYPDITAVDSNYRGREQSTFPFWAGNPEGPGSIDRTQGKTGTTPGPSLGWWGGRFYGPAYTGSNTTLRANTHPTGVTGNFTAFFPNGNAIGAFGATRQE